MLLILSVTSTHITSMKNKLLLCLLCYIFSSQIALAQSTDIHDALEKAAATDEVVQIILNDNSTVTGKILEVDSNTVKISSENGIFLLRLIKIQEVKIINTDDFSSNWYANPARNKLFITPSGRMLEPGSGYYQNTYIIFSTLSYGISEHFTVSGSISMIPSLGIRNQFFSLGVKVGSNISKNISISGTASYYSIIDYSFGSIYTAGTYSKGRGDLTAGLGMSFTREGNSSPILILGGQLRVSEGFAVISENVIFSDNFEQGLAIGSLGGRFIGKKIAADLGFFTGSGLDAFVPFASFTVKL